MKNTLVLMVIAVSTIQSYATEYEKPVNYQKDLRPGQVVSKMKTTIQGEITETNVKICFQSAASRDKNINSLPGCTFTKLIDSPSELKYSSNCEHNGFTTYYWKKISENEIEFITDNKSMKVEGKNIYTGPNCDSDAVKM